MSPHKQLNQVSIASLWVPSAEPKGGATLDILSNWIMGLGVAIEPYNIMIAVVGII